MSISIPDIKKVNPTKKMIWKSVQKDSGLSLVVEPLPVICKRLVGKTRFPRGRDGKNVHVSLGVFGKEIKTQTDINKTLETWNELKEWCRETELHPHDFFRKDEIEKSGITLKEVFDSFMEVHSQKTKKQTWTVSQDRLNQMLRYYGENKPLIDFEDPKQGRRLVLEMQDSIGKGQRNQGASEQSARCRRLLKQVFNHAINKGWLIDGQNPALLKPDTEGLGHKPKGNPHVTWEQVPELLQSINKNSCRGTLLTQLATKFYFLSLIRVGACVRLEWDWFDESQDLWVIPGETPGLKRKFKNTGKEWSHKVPMTPQLHVLLNQLRELNGDQKYVFHSLDGKKYPHLNPETINTYLRRLGWENKQTAHGWRDVVVTEGQEEGDFEFDAKEIIRRQIGHTENKQGAIGAYDNTEFLPDRRKFLEWWSKEMIKQGMEI